MVRGKTDICTWFQNTGCPYWRIYPKGNIQSGNVIMQSKQDENQSAGDALEELKFKLRVINRGTYTLTAFHTPERLPNKGYNLTDIEIPAEEGSASSAAMQTPQVSGLTPDDVKKQVEAALNAYKTEQELAQLRKDKEVLMKEKADLEKQVNDPWNKVIGAIAPYAGNIVSGAFGQQAQVAGLPKTQEPEDNNINEITDEQQETVENFITVLCGVDPDWCNTLKRLTAKIQKEPGVIGTVKMFI